MSDRLSAVIGTSFQHVIDSYFWYMPFCSVRQCKHVMDVVAKVPEEEWVAKRNEPEIRDEHKHGRISGRDSKIGLHRASFQ